MATSKYKVKYTSDISQHKLAMTEYKAQVKGTMDGVKGMLKFGVMGGGMIGGAGVAGISTYVTKLGAEMEKTRTAFTVFLGDVDKANRAIEKLMDFSDITPFTPDVVLAAGRGLLAVGVSVDDLCSKLTMLGDVSSGVNMPLQDMVSIYTKAMNKGKIQAEEVNQLTDRGVPIVKALADVYRIAEKDVSKWGEQGKLTFAGLEAGLQRLANGKYAGMMAKQSQTLIGLWSTLQGKIARIGGEIGELANPEIKRVLGDIINELDRLKQTGELQENIRAVADAMQTTVSVIAEIVTWVASNREALATLGVTAASIVLWNRLNAAVATGTGLIKLLTAANITAAASRQALVPRFLLANMKNVGMLIRSQIASVGHLTVAMGALATAAAGVGAAVAGWKVGRALADVLDTDQDAAEFTARFGYGVKTNPYGKMSDDELVKDYHKRIAGTKHDRWGGDALRYVKYTRQYQKAAAYKGQQKDKASKADAAKLAQQQAAAAQNEKVDKYLKTLEQKLKLQQLINQENRRGAAIQQALNAAEQKAGTLTDAQKKRVAEAAGRNFDAKASGGVSNYLRDMERQLRIQSLLNQGKQREAAIQEAIDSAKQKAGGKLTDAQRAQVSDAAGKLYDSQFQRQYFFAPEQQTITDSVQRMGGYIGNAAPDLGMKQIPDIVKRIETIAGDLNSKVKDPNMISDNDGGDWQL